MNFNPLSLTSNCNQNHKTLNKPTGEIKHKNHSLDMKLSSKHKTQKLKIQMKQKKLKIEKRVKIT